MLLQEIQTLLVSAFIPKVRLKTHYFPKETNTQSGISINDEMTDDNNTIEEISRQYDNIMDENNQI